MIQGETRGKRHLTLLLVRYTVSICLLIALALLAGCSSGGGGSNDGGIDDDTTNNTDTQLPPSQDPPVNDSQPQKITFNEDLAAIPEDLSTAFNNLGNGIAIWALSTGTGTRIMSSYFDATGGVWSPEQTVIAEHKPAHRSPLVRIPDNDFLVASDNQFAVIWENDSRIFAGIYDITTQSWSQSELSETLPATHSMRNPRIAAAGSDFIAVWTNASSGSVYSLRYFNGMWGNEPAVVQSLSSTPELYHSIMPDIEIGSSGSMFAVMWVVNTREALTSTTTNTVFSSTIDLNNTTPVWSTPRPLNAQNINGRVQSPKLNADLNRFLFSFIQSISDSDLSLSIYSASFELQAVNDWTPTILVNEAPILNISYPMYSAAMGAAGFAYIWRDEGADITDSINTNYVRLFLNSNNTGWLPSEILSGDQTHSSSQKLAANDIGFAVLWRELGPGGSIFDYSRRHIEGNWQPRDTLARPSAAPIRGNYFISGNNDNFHLTYSGSDQNNNAYIYLQTSTLTNSWSSSNLISSWPLVSLTNYALWYTPVTTNAGDNVFLSWLQSDEVTGSPRIHPYVANISSTDIATINLMPTAYQASGISSFLTTDEAGNSLALSIQFNNGLIQRYASVRKNGEWSRPEQIDSDIDYSRSNYDLNDMEEENSVSTNGIQFCAIWNINPGNATGRVYDGENWGNADLTIASGSSRSTVDLVAYKTGFLAAWERYDNISETRSLQSSTYSGGTWTTTEIASIAGDWATGSENSFAKIAAATKDEYMLVWVEKAADGSKTVVSRLKTDTTTTPEHFTVATAESNFTIKDMKVIPITAGDYVISFVRDETFDISNPGSTQEILEIYRFTPGQTTSWTTIHSEPEIDRYSIAPNNESVAIVYSQGSDVLTRIYSLASELWTLPVVLANSPTSSPYTISVVGNGNQFIAAWEPYWRSPSQWSIYNGSIWLDPTTLSNQPDSIVRNSPYVSPYRDNFGIIWSETDLNIDSSVSYISAQMGGF